MGVVRAFGLGASQACFRFISHLKQDLGYSPVSRKRGKLAACGDASPHALNCLPVHRRPNAIANVEFPTQSLSWSVLPIDNDLMLLRDEG